MRLVDNVVWVETIPISTVAALPPIALVASSGYLRI